MIFTTVPHLVVVVNMPLLYIKWFISLYINSYFICPLCDSKFVAIQLITSSSICRCISLVDDDQLFATA
jgi:hypothetical protein